MTVTSYQKEQACFVTLFYVAPQQDFGIYGRDEEAPKSAQNHNLLS